MTRTTLSALLAAGLCAQLASAQDDGFKPLFNGTNMDGFEFILRDKGADPSETWTVEDGMIRCTGQPAGYFHTKESYGDYVLKFDLRYPKNPGNSGFLIHITDGHKVWPKCVEVQGMYDQLGLAFAIMGAEGPDNRKDKDLSAAVMDARKPHQEWNTVEITCKGGTITTTLNGRAVGKGEYSLSEGQIGFQSEGAPIDFRNIMIKDLK